MNRKTYNYIVGVIMVIVALAHLARVIFSASIIIDGWTVPLWPSWLAVLVAGYIAYASFRFASEK
jgi:hypothetical protein